MSIVLNISNKSEEEPNSRLRQSNDVMAFNGVRPSIEPLSSSSSLNKKNKYLIRDFLGVENDFYRDDEDRDEDASVDRK